MAITTQNNRNDYIADGAQTQFNYTFKVFAASDLAVYLNDALQTGGYSVSGVGNDAGGVVTFSSPPANGTRVAIIRSVPYTQDLVFVDNDPLPAKSLNDGFDKVTILVQQLLEKLARALTFKTSSTQSDKTLDDLVANKYLRVKGDASGIELVDITGQGVLGVPVSTADGGTGTNNSGAAAGEVLVATSTGVFARTPNLFLAATGLLGWSGEYFRRQGAGEIRAELGASGRIHLTTSNNAGAIRLASGTSVVSEWLDAPGVVRLIASPGKALRLAANNTDFWEIGTDGTLRPLNNAPTSLGLRAISVFTSSGTWNRPASVRKIRIRAVGGGGAGGGAVATGAGQLSGGGGGGSGAYAEVLVDTTGITSLTITIGAGGAGSAGAAGGDGGTTSIVSGSAVSISCPGGGGGSVSVAGSTVAAPGGSAASQATASGSAILASVLLPGSPGYPFGAYSGFGVDHPCGASTPLGASVIRYFPPSGTLGNGPNGAQYGSGGGGALNNASTGGAAAGGNGANGVVIIEEYE